MREAYRERAARDLPRAPDPSVVEGQTKTCSKCGETKPLTEFHFRRTEQTFRTDCKACHRARCAQRREDPEERDRQRQRARSWHERNKPRAHAARRKWAEENREKVLSDGRAYATAHREEARQKARRWYRENTERARAANKEWKRRNPERFREMQSAAGYRRRARLAGVACEDFTRAEIYDREQGRCGICGEHVERSLATLDHVRPISRGGSHTRDNVQIAHGLCNSRKGARLPEELTDAV